MTRTAKSTALLVAGYSMAIASGSRLGPRAWRERHVQPFLVFETGTVMVATGLALRRKPFLATLNGVTAVGLAVAWVFTGRLLRR